MAGENTHLLNPSCLIRLCRKANIHVAPQDFQARLPRKSQTDRPFAPRGSPEEDGGRERIEEYMCKIKQRAHPSLIEA
jgi:hypothetical protein